jgi:hypothetical protein
VILNGDEAERHTDNVSLVYSTLVGNGYAPENLFVFSYQDTNEPMGDESEEPEVNDSQQLEDSESEEPGFLTHAPTYGNLEMFFEEFLRKAIDDKDYLTIYVTGHGTHKGRTSEICIRTIYSRSRGPVYSVATLSEIELADLLNGIEPAQTVFIFDQCHSGFGDGFPMDDYLVISRSSVTETGTCTHFARRLFDLLNPDEQGRNVSIGEAFETTLRFDQDFRDGVYTPTMTGPLKDVADQVFLSK